MYTIKIISNFSGAHFLRNYQGKCESLHGHNWKVEILVESDAVDKAGMVMDFGVLKKMAENVLDDLDHKYLNEVEFFKQHNPSSEEIARYIFERLEHQIGDKDCQLKEVRVWETDNSCAIYHH